MSGSPTIGIDARKIDDYGIGRYLTGLLLGLAEITGPERYVLFLRPSHLERPTAPLSRLLEHERFRAVACDAPLYSLREILAFRNAARRQGLDVLHFPHYVRSLDPGCPVAVTIHDPIHLVHPPSLLGRLYARGMMSWSVRSAAVLFTVSNAVREDLARLLSVPVARLTVTPNSVDPRFVPPAREEREAVLRDRGLKEPFVLCVASHRPHKNLVGAAEAFRRAELRGATLAVPARDETAARRLMPFRSVDRPFRILEEVTDEDLRRLYAAARVVLIPTLYEGFGLPALEAAACGAAVLATDLPVHREVLGDAVMFSPSGSPEDLAGSLRALWDDGERRRRLRELGPEQAARFPRERSARLTLEGYRAAVRDG